MGSAFHQLCPRYSGTLTLTAPTAIRLWDTFTFFNILLAMPARTAMKYKTNRIYDGVEAETRKSRASFQIT